MKTKCDRCRLNEARDKARENGLHLSLIPEPGTYTRGLEIYAHPIDERWDSKPEYKVGVLNNVTDLCTCGGRGE